MQAVSSLINEVKKYYQQAEAEFKTGNYSLAVGNLNYIVTIIERVCHIDDHFRDDIYWLLCRSYKILNDFKNAHRVCDKAQAYFKEKDIVVYGRYNNFRGSILSRENRHQEAIEMYHKTLDLLENKRSLNASKRKKTAYYNMGNTYLRLSKIKPARKSYEQAYRLAQMMEIDKTRGNILVGLGVSHYFEGELDEAEYYYQHAIKILSREKSFVGYVRLLHNLADVYYDKGQLDKAKKYYKKTLEDDSIYQRDRVVAVGSLQSLALVTLEEEDDVEAAIKYCRKGISIALKGVVTRFTSKMEREVGELFLLMARCFKKAGQTSEFKIYLSQAETIFRKYNQEEFLKKVEEYRS